MTIALLTDGIYPYVIGGMQRHSFYLAKYLAAAGVRVDLYHTNQSKKNISELEGFTEEEKKNIRSFVIPFPKFEASPGHYIRESYTYSESIWNVFKKQAKVDFIIAKGFAGWELINQKSKGTFLPPVGVNFHGYEMFQPQPGFISWLKSRFLLRSPVMFNMKHADYLFSYGGKITQLLLELGFTKNKILELPAGISPDWLNENPRPSEKKRKFVFSGRFERRKGVEELSRALRKMLTPLNDFEFHFIGPIPKNKQIFSEKIIYHGLITDNDQMKNLLKEMDVLVCPSHSEGMPNVVMEGLASGLAVIATNTGATSVMVNETNGWLIEPGNESQLQNALQKAQEISSGLLDQKKKAAVNHIKENFLWEAIAAQTISLIEKKIN
ncbi:MAG: glycosyltransferase family 4 protein [Bacteroidia bacterium]